MAQEQKRQETPQPEADASKIGHTKHGIPPEVVEEEPTGYPDSGRHQTEIAPAKHEG